MVERCWFRQQSAIALLAHAFGQDFFTLEYAATAEIEKLHIQAASISILQGDKIICSKGVGAANVETGE